VIEALDRTDDIFFISRPVNFPDPDPFSPFFLRLQLGLERQKGLIKFP
jgi:hypothetical protein